MRTIKQGRANILTNNIVKSPLEKGTNLALSILAEGTIIFTTYIKSTT